MQIKSLINIFYQYGLDGLINIISFYFRMEYLPQGGRLLIFLKHLEMNKTFKNVHNFILN